MNQSRKLASRIVKRLEKCGAVHLAGRGEFYRQLDEHLRQIAKTHGIALRPEASLVRLALSAVARLGVTGEERHIVAMDAITRVVTRNPSKQRLEDRSVSYIRNTWLPLKTQKLRRRGFTYNRIRSHPQVRRLMKRFNIRETTLRRYYQTGKEPNLTVKDTGMLGLRPAQRNVFEAYKEKGSSFETFWFRVIQNEARHVSAQWKTQKRRTLNNALRFSPGGEAGAIRENRIPGNSTDLDALLSVPAFRRELTRLNPDYLTALKIIKERNLDITRPRHLLHLRQELSLEKPKFDRFMKRFLTGLKSALKKIDADTFSEAHDILRAAKRNCNISPSPVTIQSRL